MLNGDPTDGWDNVNYIDKVFGTGINQKHNVTIQGGSDKMRYFASVGLFRSKMVTLTISLTRDTI